jgi:4-carboxymuconolactone decarboxylase
MTFGAHDEEFFWQGVELMRAVNGDAAADAATARHERAVERGTTDRDDFAIRTAWGFMHHRPILSLRDRAFAMMVSDMVQVRPGALGDHVRLALYAGMTREEIEEVLFHLTLYIGFPTTREAGNIVRQVFADLDAEATQT